MNKEYDKYVVQARRGSLPADFNKWDMANGDGWTVAHEVTYWHDLPATFSQWGLADKSGWAVAHGAAKYGRLPYSFDMWGMVDKDWISVLKCLLLNKHGAKHMDRWQNEKPLCRAEADWVAFKAELPEIYSKYAIVELFDADTVQEIRLL
jgi:hypothetical protein